MALALTFGNVAVTSVERPAPLPQTRREAGARAAPSVPERLQCELLPVFCSNTEPHRLLGWEGRSLVGCLAGPQIRLLIHSSLIETDNRMLVTRGDGGARGGQTEERGSNTQWQKETRPSGERTIACTEVGL